MDKEYINVILVSIWTLATLWFWALVPISFVPTGSHPFAWMLTAVIVWLVGLYFLLEKPWKKRS